MSVQVRIIDGLFKGKVKEGVYTMISEPKISESPNGQGRTHRVTVFDPAAERERMFWVLPENVIRLDENGNELGAFSTAAPRIAPVVPDEERLEEIKRRFAGMDKLTTGSINGVIRSLIISGSAGIGKTYNLEKKLSDAEDRGMIQYSTVKGKISPLGLYVKLWENRGSDAVLVLDDVQVFEDENVLNLLKAALDTSDRRVISWATTSPYLQENDIPNDFEFQGSVIFITNTNIDKELAKETKHAAHLAALVSRSLYLDLCVHTKKDAQLWVVEVATSTKMLENRGLTEQQAISVLDWMTNNTDKLRSVSLRTALQVADFVITDPTGWMDLAEITMFANKMF